MPNAGDPLLVETTPGFIVASAMETADSSTFTASTQIGSVTASVVAGVTYLIEAEAQLRSSVSGDKVRAVLREDNSSGTAIDYGDLIMTSGSDDAGTIPLRALHTAVSTGSKTFVVTASRTAGTGNIAREASVTHPQLFTVQVT